MTITIEKYAQNIRKRIKAGFKTPVDIAHMARAIRVTLPGGQRLPHTERRALNNQIRMACETAYKNAAKALSKTSDPDGIQVLSSHAMAFGCHAYYGNPERTSWIKEFYGMKPAEDKTESKRKTKHTLQARPAAQYHAQP